MQMFDKKYYKYYLFAIFLVGLQIQFALIETWVVLSPTKPNRINASCTDAVSPEFLQGKVEKLQDSVIKQSYDFSYRSFSPGKLTKFLPAPWGVHLDISGDGKTAWMIEEETDKSSLMLRFDIANNVSSKISKRLPIPSSNKAFSFSESLFVGFNTGTELNSDNLKLPSATIWVGKAGPTGAFSHQEVPLNAIIVDAVCFRRQAVLVVFAIERDEDKKSLQKILFYHISDDPNGQSAAMRCFKEIIVGPLDLQDDRFLDFDKLWFGGGDGHNSLWYLESPHVLRFAKILPGEEVDLFDEKFKFVINDRSTTDLELRTINLSGLRVCTSTDGDVMVQTVPIVSNGQPGVLIFAQKRFRLDEPLSSFVRLETNEVSEFGYATCFLGDDLLIVSRAIARSFSIDLTNGVIHEKNKRLADFGISSFQKIDDSCVCLAGMAKGDVMTCFFVKKNNGQ